MIFTIHSICFKFGYIVDCTVCSQSKQVWTANSCNVEKIKRFSLLIV